VPAVLCGWPGRSPRLSAGLPVPSRTDAIDRAIDTSASCCAPRQQPGSNPQECVGTIAAHYGEERDARGRGIAPNARRAALPRAAYTRPRRPARGRVGRGAEGPCPHPGRGPAEATNWREGCPSLVTGTGVSACGARGEERGLRRAGLKPDALFHAPEMSRSTRAPAAGPWAQPPNGSLAQSSPLLSFSPPTTPSTHQPPPSQIMATATEKATPRIPGSEGMATETEYHNAIERVSRSPSSPPPLWA